MGNSIWLSGKGVRYVLAPKRGAWNTINPEISASLTAKGQNNWIGTFISPDIKSVERSNVLGSTKPTKITLVGGGTLYFDGTSFKNSQGTLVEVVYV